MFFLPKGRGAYWYIGLVEVVWKVCAAVVNCRKNQIVTLHDALRGFRAGRGMGTVTLEAKLAHQLAGISYKLLFQVFLDVQKAYNSLHRGRCMEILRGCRIRQNVVRLIAHHW